MLGKTEGKSRMGWQMTRWLDSITDSVDMNWSKLQEIVEDRGAWWLQSHEVTKSRTQLNDRTTLICLKTECSSLSFDCSRGMCGRRSWVCGSTRWVFPEGPRQRTLIPRPEVQWLRIRLPMQGTRVRFLVQEDSTCCWATKPEHPRACVLQQEKPL